MFELFAKTAAMVWRQRLWLVTIMVVAILGRHGWISPEVQLGIVTGIVAGLAVRED